MKMAHKKSVRPLEIKYLSSFLIKFNRILRQIIFDLAIIPIKGRCEWGNFSSVIFQTEAEIKQTVFISLFFDIGLAMLIYGSTPSFQRRRNWFFFYYFSFMTKLTEMFTFRNARVEFQHLSKVVIHKSHIELSFYCTLLALLTLLGHLVSLMAIPLLSISYHFAVTYFLFTTLYVKCFKCSDFRLCLVSIHSVLHPSNAALHGFPFRCQLEILNFKVKVDHDYQITDLFDGLCYSFCQQEWVKTYYMRIVHISLLLLNVSLYTTNLQSLGTVFFFHLCVFLSICVCFFPFVCLFF